MSIATENRWCHWSVFAHLATRVVDLSTVGRRGSGDKDLELLLLRHRRRLLQRPHPPRLTRAEKRTLAILTAKLARLTVGLRSQLDR